MSTNQFSSEIPQAVLWGWQNQQPAVSFYSPAFKLPKTQSSSSSSTTATSAPLVPMFSGGNREGLVDIEPMFEKALTPSDVGKLNRLVIPKQHAETYFPLSSFSGEAATDKGMALTFQDELEKSWRFRYSYWNSSQSYVLTRGWSRFVKEKHLDAGDIVTFHRVGKRLYIGWRRRYYEGPNLPALASETVDYYHAHPSYTSDPQYESYLHATGTGVGDDDHVQERQQHTGTTSSSGGNPKRSVLRLFGVNMECHEACSTYDDQNIHDGSETLARPDSGNSAHSADQQSLHHLF